MTSSITNTAFAAFSAMDESREDGSGGVKEEPKFGVQELAGIKKYFDQAEEEGCGGLSIEKVIS